MVLWEGQRQGGACEMLGQRAEGGQRQGGASDRVRFCRRLRFWDGLSGKGSVNLERDGLVLLWVGLVERVGRAT